MNQPELVASPSVTMKWADYSLSRNPGETFVDYLNRMNFVLSRGEPEDEVSVDVLRYVFNRSDMSPQESMNLMLDRLLRTLSNMNNWYPALGKYLCYFSILKSV